MTLASTPFASLTPDLLLDALEASGLHPDGRLLALNSYENRVYQVGMDDGPSRVVKCYRPERWSDSAILEEHTFIGDLAAAEVPVVAPLALHGTTLHFYHGHRYAIYPSQGGRAPEPDDEDTLRRIGRCLGRVHALGAQRDFVERPTLDIASFGDEPLDYVLAHDFVPPELVEVYHGVAAQALDGVRRCFDRAGRIKSLRLHGDCHLGNVLWAVDGPHLVDFDDARMGPAIQDLWMLLSGEREDMARQLRTLLEGYRQFFDFDRRELQLIEALRTLRLIHYSGWIARRWNDPAFPVAFPWFEGQRYWQDRILELREQIALLDEEPLSLG